MLYILTLQELKQAVGIPELDVQDDVLLAATAEGLQGRIEEYLNRALLRVEDEVDICDGGARALLLSRFPVESVASVHVSWAQAWDAQHLIQPDQYTVHYDRGRVIYAPYGSTVKKWDAGEQNIRVQYTGGYVAAGVPAAAGETAMPEAIRGAFRIQFSYEWRNRENLGKTSAAMQGVSAALPAAGLLQPVMDALGHFRRF